MQSGLCLTFSRATARLAPDDDAPVTPWAVDWLRIHHLMMASSFVTACSFLSSVSLPDRPTSHHQLGPKLT